LKESKQRLDKLVQKKRPLLSRAEIKRIIESNGVLVCGEVERDAGKKIFDSVEITFNEDVFQKIADAEIANTDLRADNEISEKIRVIYEDDDVAVIEKPAGLVAHPSPSCKTNTLVHGLIAKWPGIVSVGDDSTRPGIVHRLDKDVSGVMAVAKTQKGFNHLKNQFKSGTVVKKYKALVYGCPLSAEGTIKDRIKRSEYNPTKQMVSRDETGKEAVTKYKVLERKIVDGEEMSLLEVQTFTGRTHQIRIHLANIGCPIVGDKKYLPSEMAKNDRSGRIMLYAEFLRIKLLNGEEREFVAKFQNPLDSKN